MRFTNAMQQEVEDFEQTLKAQWSPLENIAKLAEETGELARDINQRFGSKKKKPSEKDNDTEAEIGDILYTVICIANLLELDIDQAFKKAMKKCYERDKDLYEKK
jgi:NTP pyrophosphatase (non-canonical NTP hydrolase)